MIEPIELYLIISNTILFGIVMAVVGYTVANKSPKTRTHPDFLDPYGNTIIDNTAYDSENYEGVILYDSDDDDEDETADRN